MTLKDLIINNSLTGTAKDVAALLNAKTIATVSTETISVEDFVKLLTPKEANDALKALKAASSTNESLEALYQRFNAKGLQHDGLEALRKAGAPEEFIDRIATILEATISLCEQSGLPAATEASVQAALDAIANDTKRKRLDGIMHGIGQTFDLNPDTTMVDAVKQLARGVLAEEQAANVEKALKE